MQADQLRTSNGPAPDQLRVYHTGVWAPPKLLAEAKSDENERTKAESSGSNTPWADGPANLYPFDIIVFPDGGHLMYIHF